MGILSYWRAKREFKSFEQLLKYMSDNSIMPQDGIRRDTRGQGLLNHPKDKSNRSLKQYFGLKD